MRLVARLLIIDALAEAAWAWLRYLDNRRKHKPLTPPWDYMWAWVVYGCINGHIPLSDIEREWREGTPYAYRGKKRIDPDIVGVDRMKDVDSSYTVYGQKMAAKRKGENCG